jgi:hypothetical protein
VRRFFKAKWFAAPAAAILAATARDAHACAMCGLPPGDIATHAYNTSVLFMLTVPYAIVAVGAVVGLVAYRNACRREANPGYSDQSQSFPRR